MIRLGLTGYPLSHSLSPVLHAAAFDALDLVGEYRLYPVAPEDTAGLAKLAEQVRDGKLLGLNVTIPHKQNIIPELDELTPSALAIGAVNTLYMKDSHLIGHNTDAAGFLSDLARFLPSNIPCKDALILGAGGAARAVAYALLINGWTVTLAVRRADFEQADTLIDSFRRQAVGRSMRSVLMETEDLNQFESGLQLVVNATPIGMAPETGYSPWPAGLPFPRGVAVYDVVYNPRQTRLVQEARGAGLRAITGLGMLVEQAMLAFSCWTGQRVSREIMLAAVEE